MELLSMSPLFILLLLVIGGKAADFDCDAPSVYLAFNTPGEHFINCSSLTTLLFEYNVSLSSGSVRVNGGSNLILDFAESGHFSVAGADVTFSGIGISNAILSAIEVENGTVNFLQGNIQNSNSQLNNQGGAISVHGGQVTVTQSFIGNNAGVGGAIYVDNEGSFSIIRSTLHQANNIDSRGIVVNGGYASSDYCTIQTFSATGFLLISGSASISHSIINSVIGISSFVESYGNNILASHTNVATKITDFLGLAGALDELESYGNLQQYFPLIPGGPAVNSIADASNIFPDQLGRPGSLNGGPDIGAVESNYFAGVSFASSNVEIAEGVATLTFIVKKPFRSINPVSITYILISGSAVVGVDFKSTTGIIFWNYPETQNKTFTVSLFDPDFVKKDSRFFQVALTSASATFSNRILNVTINDNDAECPANSHAGDIYCECDEGFSGLVNGSGICVEELPTSNLPTPSCDLGASISPKPGNSWGQGNLIFNVYDLSVVNHAASTVYSVFLFLGNASTITQTWNLELQAESFIHNGVPVAVYKLTNFYTINPSGSFNGAGFIATSSGPYVVSVSCSLDSPAEPEPEKCQNLGLSTKLGSNYVSGGVTYSHYTISVANIGEETITQIIIQINKPASTQVDSTYNLKPLGGDLYEVSLFGNPFPPTSRNDNTAGFRFIGTGPLTVSCSTVTVLAQ